MIRLTHKFFFHDQKYWLYALLLCSISAITLFVYWPGLSGAFLLDDIPNLSPLGRWENQDTLTRSLLFVLSGESGPTGRPLAMLSFLLNDTTWPSALVRTFKLTNVVIHLLNGLLIFWFLHLLLEDCLTKKPHRLAVASATAFIWLIHPMQVSTVLYVVQRMTELSTFFTLTALIVWLYGRKGISNGDIRSTWATTSGIGLFGLLAILSKENGALIPLYILAIETLLYNKDSCTKFLKKWLALFAVIPSLIIVSYLLHAGINSDMWLLSRPYAFSEHLLSQMNALAHYLAQIAFPRMSGAGIFHDNFPVSRNLMDPPETLFSLTVLLFLVAAAWILRRRTPLFTFAIIWFLAGHLMESTVLPLELYFEHRNYLPMLGILLALAAGIISLSTKLRIPAYLFLIGYLSLLTTITYSNTSLWGRPLDAAIVWANENPHSIRAQMTARSAIQVYANKNKVQGERYYLEKMVKLHPDKPLVQMEWLDFQCRHDEIKIAEFESFVDKLKTAPLHISILNRMQGFVSQIINGNCNGKLQLSDALKMLTAVEMNASLQSPNALHITHYIYSEVYAELRDFNKVMHHLELAYQYNPVLDVRLQQAIYLQTAGLHAEALALLDSLINENSPLADRLRRSDVEDLIAIIQQSEH